MAKGRQKLGRLVKKKLLRKDGRIQRYRVREKNLKTNYSFNRSTRAWERKGREPSKLFRNMFVLNMSEDKTQVDYPILAEFRITIVTTEKLPKEEIKRLLRISVKNVYTKIFGKFRASEKKRKVKRTEGFEINKEISKGEAGRIGIARKYVRIKIPSGTYEYNDKELNTFVKSNSSLRLGKKGYVFFKNARKNKKSNN